MRTPSVLTASLAAILSLPHALVLADQAQSHTATGRVQQSSPAIADMRPCTPKSSDYPFLSLLLNEQGTSRIRFVVASDGKLESAKVEKSSGHERLDEVAVRSLSNCQFRPGKDSEGKPIGGSFLVEYVWKLPN
jgi:TonB family protein